MSVTTGSWWSRLDRRGANAVVGAAAFFVVAALVVVGVLLHGTQASARKAVIVRFHARAEIVSALTQAVLGDGAASSEATQLYGRPTISIRVMDRTVDEGNLAYAVVVDRRGVVAASRTLTEGGRARVVSSPAARAVLAGASLSVSDIVRDRVGGVAVIDLAVAVASSEGRRVLVTGLPASVLSGLLGSYLQRVPTGTGTAYVVDSSGGVIGSRNPATAVGNAVPDPALLASIQREPDGPFGRNGYFVANAVPGSSWRVVLTAGSATLFGSVSGSRKWTPWVLYVALGIVALGFLALLRRLLTNASALSAANSQLAGNNARLKSSNTLLREAAELARSNRELEQFASIASHDLQEPLRKVQTFAAHLQAREHDRLSEEGQDFLRRMSAAAARMRALIDDLLMFSRVSTTGRPFVPVDLDDVVAQVLIDLELSIEETGAKVVIADLPTIDADPVQMRQLLQNLLENALKFRREGIVPEVAVNASVTDAVAELTVHDNGLGFEPQYATRIFRAFERLHGTSAYPGTGIGLALCRKIVERHHGTITADSELGVRTVFTVRLPIERPADTVTPTSLFPDAMDEATTHALR